jgi:hypothetical protein
MSAQIESILADLASHRAEYVAKQQEARRKIGSLIRQKREELGYSRDAAGALLGITGRSTLWLVEEPSEKRPMSEEYAADIYRAMCNLPAAPASVRGFRRRALSA